MFLSRFWRSLALVLPLLCMLGCRRAKPHDAAQDDSPTASSQPVEADDSWREALRQKCLPSAVNWRILHYKNEGWYCGSGVVLHEAGYVLVCAHVYLTPQAGLPSIYLADGTAYPCRVIALSRHADVYLVKVETDQPLVPATFAENNGPRPGMQVLAFGQPKGEFHTQTWAEISRLNIDDEERFELLGGEIGPGFSGGAVFSRDGEVLGMINDDDKARPGLGKAVPIQRIRRELDHSVAEHYQLDGKLYPYTLDLVLRPVREPKIVALLGNSGGSGLQVGDVLVRIGDVRIDDSMHYFIAVLELKSADPVPVIVRRDGELLEFALTPSPRAPRPAVGPLRPGLRMRAVAGSFGPILNFDSRQPSATGVVPTIDLTQVGQYIQGVTVRFDGYVSVPSDGAYTFDIDADLGGSVTVAGLRVAVRDEMSGPDAVTTPVQLRAGLHTIAVDYYYVSGKFHERLPQSLQVFYEGPGLQKQPIPAEALFTAQPPPEDQAEAPPADITEDAAPR